jgi:hypothetical protein
MAKLTANGAHVLTRARSPRTGTEWVLRSDGAVLKKYRGGTWTVHTRHVSAARFDALVADSGLERVK